MLSNYVLFFNGPSENAYRASGAGRYRTQQIFEFSIKPLFLLQSNISYVFIFLQNAMEVMGLIAVLVNCALIGLSGQVQRMFPEMSTTQTILLIVALEHIMLILHYLISYSIPDLPEWVATEIAKVEFARRQAECPCSTTAQENNGLEIGR